MASFARHVLVGAKPALCGAVGLAAGLQVPATLADKKDKGQSDPGRPMFDPEALERGAAALRDINKSPYGKQVWSVCMSNQPECDVGAWLCSAGSLMLQATHAQPPRYSALVMESHMGSWTLLSACR